ncbi:MAG: dihydrofolate reductase [Ignavibacteriae bacterium]|nr:dihydrofolate reductase [Ignavibacteriota bacterium]
MRKVILNLAVSLDGFIEGPNGEYDWCFTDQDYNMTEFFKRTDAIFFGRKSYELLMRTEDNPYPEMAKYVFSRTLHDLDGATLISNNIKESVKEIKSQNGKDIWLFGGAKLVTDFMNFGLVDELMLSIHPILLGSGTPLFTNINNRIPLVLTNSQTFSTGLVQLLYKLSQ